MHNIVPTKSTNACFLGILEKPAMKEGLTFTWRTKSVKELRSVGDAGLFFTEREFNIKSVKTLAFSSLYSPESIKS